MTERPAITHQALASCECMSRAREEAVKTLRHEAIDYFVSHAIEP